MSAISRRPLRVVLLAVVALVAGVLAGCANTTSSASKPGALEVWVRGSGDSQQAYQKLFAAFTAKTGIKVHMFMTLTDFETKVNAAAAGHNLPDVVVDDAAQLGAFRSEGILQPVDRASITGGDQLTAKAWQSALGSDGHYYAVPFSAQANLLFERSDWMKQAGLTPPTTWSALLTTAKRFTSGNRYGLAVPGSTSRGYISWYWSTFLWQAGGDYFRSVGNGKYVSTIDSPRAIAAAQWFENLSCTDKVTQPGTLNDVTTDTNKAFQTGVTGLYYTGPYAYATNDATAIKGKYVVVAPPAGPANADTLAEGTDIYLMAGSQHNSEVKQLAEYMITPAAQRIGMTAVPSSTIVRLSVNRDVNTAAVHGDDPRWVLAQQEYLQHGHYEPDYMPDWPSFRQATSDALNAMIAHCSSPAAAMRGLNSQFTSLLKQQGVLGS